MFAVNLKALRYEVFVREARPMREGIYYEASYIANTVDSSMGTIVLYINFSAQTISCFISRSLFQIQQPIGCRGGRVR